MTKGCCGSSSTSHSHAHGDDEYDPCMAKEIAAMERDRILYEKFKSQSDKFLMGLNIRLDQGRTRGAVRPEEEDDIHSDCDLEESTAFRPKVAVSKPSDWADFSKRNNGKRIFLVACPCDDRVNQRVAQEEEDLIDPVKILEKSVPQNTKKDFIISQFSKPVCVCGKCEDPDRKVSGTLRSLMLLLRGRKSVLVMRSGGLLGMWTTTDGPLESFVARYL
jgi:hypothetical protein